LEICGVVAKGGICGFFYSYMVGTRIERIAKVIRAGIFIILFG
jgi:hypothetical protein